MDKMMECPFCHAKVNSEKRFCTACGKKIVSVVVPIPDTEDNIKNDISTNEISDTSSSIHQGTVADYCPVGHFVPNPASFFCPEHGLKLVVKAHASASGSLRIEDNIIRNETDKVPDETNENKGKVKEKTEEPKPLETTGKIERRKENSISFFLLALVMMLISIGVHIGWSVDHGYTGTFDGFSVSAGLLSVYLIFSLFFSSGLNFLYRIGLLIAPIGIIFTLADHYDFFHLGFEIIDPFADTIHSLSNMNRLSNEDLGFSLLVAVMVFGFAMLLISSFTNGKAIESAGDGILLLSSFVYCVFSIKYSIEFSGTYFDIISACRIPTYMISIFLIHKGNRA